MPANFRSFHFIWSCDSEEHFFCGIGKSLSVRRFIVLRFVRFFHQVVYFPAHAVVGGKFASWKRKDVLYYRLTCRPASFLRFFFTAQRPAFFCIECSSPASIFFARNKSFASVQNAAVNRAGRRAASCSCRANEFCSHTGMRLFFFRRVSGERIFIFLQRTHVNNRFRNSMHDNVFRRRKQFMVCREAAFFFRQTACFRAGLFAFTAFLPQLVGRGNTCRSLRRRRLVVPYTQRRFSGHILSRHIFFCCGRFILHCRRHLHRHKISNFRQSAIHVLSRKKFSTHGNSLRGGHKTIRPHRSICLPF